MYKSWNADHILRNVLDCQVEERLRFYEEGVKTRPNSAVMEEAASILEQQIRDEGGDVAMGEAVNGTDVKEKKKKKKKSKKKKEDEAGDCLCEDCDLSVCILLVKSTSWHDL